MQLHSYVYPPLRCDVVSTVSMCHVIIEKYSIYALYFEKFKAKHFFFA